MQRPSGHILPGATGSSPVLQASKQGECSCLGNPEGMWFWVVLSSFGVSLNPAIVSWENSCKGTPGKLAGGRKKKEKVIFLQDGTEGFVVKQMLLQWLFCTDRISCQSVKVGSVEQSDGQSILRGTRANFSFTRLNQGKNAVINENGHFPPGTVQEESHRSSCQAAVKAHTHFPFQVGTGLVSNTPLDPFH